MAWKTVDLQKHSVLYIFFFLQVVFQAFSFKNPAPETGFFNQYQSMFHIYAQ